VNAFVLVAAVLYGGLVAPLLPRAVYRLCVEPDQPWRTACPNGHPLPDGLSGWAGPGTCPACKASYGPGLRVVMPVTVAASLLLAFAAGARPELAVWLLLVPCGVVLAATDLTVRRLPDVVTLPMLAGAAALLGVAGLLPRSAGSWLGAVLGAAALAAFYFVMFLVNPEGMGFGDVKLAATLGLALGWYGWDVLFAGAFAGFLLGAVAGLTLIVRRRASRRTALPFGPFMLVGALLGVSLGAL
jgi:leader peptidase (prepilin peptidase) / N-methyltransferase